jgi:hypothetical protein
LKVETEKKINYKKNILKKKQLKEWGSKLKKKIIWLERKIKKKNKFNKKTKKYQKNEDKKWHKNKNNITIEEWN